MNENWRFDDPPNVAVFTTKQIMKDHYPILLVTRDRKDGAWQFNSGNIARDEDAMIVALEEVFDLDPSIAELADLPCGWIAEREKKSAPWHRYLDNDAR